VIEGCCDMNYGSGTWRERLGVALEIETGARCLRSSI